MKKITTIFIHLVFFSVGISLIYLAFGKQNFSEMYAQLQRLDYRWGILILLISVINQIIRAERWRLLLYPLKHPISLSNTFWALMFGYLVNLAIPRLGEVSRCWALSKTDKVPFVPSIGTVIVERAIDVMCLVIIVLGVLVWQYDVLMDFFWQYLVLTLWELWLSKKMLFILIISGLGLIFLIVWRLKSYVFKFSLIQKLRNIITQLILGIRTILQMPYKWAFLGYTFLIWLTYFWMTYFWFFSLPETKHLGVEVGLALLAMGSISRLAPIHGSSMGAYHYLVIQGLLLFHISETTGAVLAFVIHTTQLVYTLFVGSMATLVILWKNTTSSYSNAN